jgi:hypothetical protein
LARGLVVAGVDIVMGHHPHCLQPFETYEGGVIFYSLGNFIASEYTKSPDAVLTYGQGARRRRTERERLTVAATVYVSGRAPVVDYLPLVQEPSSPTLRMATGREAGRVDRVFRRRLGRGYRLRYGLVRRIDEIVSKVEEVREFGWDQFSWRTPFRVIRRVVTGRNMH